MKHVKDLLFEGVITLMYAIIIGTLMMGSLYMTYLLIDLVYKHGT